MTVNSPFRTVSEDDFELKFTEFFEKLDAETQRSIIKRLQKNMWRKGDNR